MDQAEQPAPSTESAAPLPPDGPSRPTADSNTEPTAPADAPATPSSAAPAPSAASPQPDKFHAWTEGARRILNEAHREALRCQAPAIHDGHLLVGVLHVGEGVGIAVLTELGFTLERVQDAARTLTEAAATTDLAPQAIMVDLSTNPGERITRACKFVIEQSVTQARIRGDRMVRPDHILLALTDSRSNGVAPRVFELLGYPPRAVFEPVRVRVAAVRPDLVPRRELVAALQALPPPSPTPLERLRAVFSRKR